MRKHTLAECNPRFIRYDGRDESFGPADALYFDCPEGHEHCSQTIPFTPDIAGNAITTQRQRNGAQWDRKGDDIATVSLTPSIRCNPSYPDARCHFHGFVTDGRIVFCSDSR